MRKALIKKIQSSFGGLLVGNIIGYSSSATLQLSENGDPSLGGSWSLFGQRISLDIMEVSWFSSIFSIGALVGSLLGIVLVRSLGRRTTMILAAVVAFLGWLIIGLSVNFGVLLTGRLLTGVYTGVACVAVTTYLGETTPAHSRGTLCTLFQVMLQIGILFAMAIGGLTTWYYLALTCAAISSVFGFLMFFNVESPVFLFSKGREDEATKVLKKLRGNNESIDEELLAMKAARKHIELNPFVWSDLLEYHNYAPLGIVILLMVGQQFCGVNLLFFNLNAIFKSTGSRLSDYASSLICSAFLPLFVLVATFLIDRLGRKILVIVSFFVMALSFGFIGLFYYISLNWYDASRSIDWLPLLSIVLFSLSFNLGLGPVPWVVMGEVLPSNLREVATGIASFLNWSASFLVIFSYESFLMIMPSYAIYWLYASMNFAMAILFIFVMRETKGKTLQEISVMYQKQPNHQS